MAFNNKLIWAVAGSAVLTLGGFALWWWKYRASSVSEETDGVPEEENEPVVDDWDPAAEGLANELPLVDLSTVKRSSQPEPAAEPEDAESAVPTRGPILTRERLRKGGDTYVQDAGAALYPTRPQGAELEPEAGDEIVFVTLDPKLPDGKVRFEAVLCRVGYVNGDELDVVVVGAIDKRKLYPPKIDHGYAPDDALVITRDRVALVLRPEPPPVLVAKSRRKRYGIAPGGLIELRPERLPADPIWASSREDVEIRVVSQDEGRAVVALEGLSGDVNVALMTAGTNGTPRPLMSWKFRLLAAAG